MERVSATRRNGLNEGWAIIARSGDIEHHQFIGALRVVARGKFDRVAGVAQAFEMYAFHDAGAVCVQAGNDAASEAHPASQEILRDLRAGRAAFFRMELHREKIIFFQDGENSRPCSQIAALPPLAKAPHKECAK